MIGKCCTCKVEIEILRERRICEPCRKVKTTAKWKLWNDKRPGRDKTKYKCVICEEIFYSHAKRKYQICNDAKCRNYFYRLSRKIKSLKQKIEKSKQTLDTHEIKYESIVQGGIVN